MSDLRARIADTLREHGTSAIPTWANERICLCGETFRSMPPGPDLADHVADVLLSLPGIAIVETGQDSVAEAIYEAHRVAYGDVCWSRWAALGEIGRDTYRRMAAAALLAAADAAEQAAR